LASARSKRREAEPDHVLSSWTPPWSFSVPSTENIRAKPTWQNQNQKQRTKKKQKARIQNTISTDVLKLNEYNQYCDNTPNLSEIGKVETTYKDLHANRKNKVSCRLYAPKPTARQWKRRAQGTLHSIDRALPALRTGKTFGKRQWSDFFIQRSSARNSVNPYYGDHNPQSERHVSACTRSENLDATELLNRSLFSLRTSHLIKFYSLSRLISCLYIFRFLISVHSELF